MASEQIMRETRQSEMTGQEKEQAFLNFLKFASNPMGDTDLRKILSLIVEPPQKTVTVDALQHYEQAKLKREQALMARNDMMQDAEQASLSRDLYKYAVDRDKQIRINALRNV